MYSVIFPLKNRELHFYFVFLNFLDSEIILLK